METELEDAAVSEVLAQSEALRIAPPLTADFVKSALLAAATHGSRISNLVLQNGKPPVPPVNGSIAWERDFFSTPLLEDATTGRVDYRQHLDNSVVAPGDTLATLTPSQPGTPGVDVFGKPIPSAKPFMPKIRAGTGVQFDEPANTFAAATIGRVRFAKGVLSVDQTYAIAGSIGLKTGHVKHPGSVDVAKDVEPDSILEAGGTVHVSGAVEESVVTAGGDILVGHGIIGGDRAKLHAGGSIEALFAENADLKAEHDIRIRRALVHCTTHTQGALLIPEGQIIGGTVCAVGGIDVGQAGSPGGVPTTLIVGVDARLQEQIAARRVEADECHEQVTRLREAIAPFKARQSSLTPILREKLTVLLNEMQKIEDRRLHADQELEYLFQESKDRAKTQIHIRRRVYPETHICIGFGKLIVTKETNGPLVAKLNDEGEVVLEPRTQI
jgi:hypothetical protein